MPSAGGVRRSVIGEAEGVLRRLGAVAAVQTELQDAHILRVGIAAEEPGAVVPDAVLRPGVQNGLAGQRRLLQGLRRELALLLPSLPPILYMQYRTPVPNWSKAPWGRTGASVRLR